MQIGVHAHPPPRRMGYVCESWPPRKGTERLLQDFDNLLMRYPDYASIRAQFDMEKACRKFFVNCEIHRAEFPDIQNLNYEELEGQTLSFSMVPLPEDAGFPALRRALQRLLFPISIGG
jgi:hypothetical protein